MLTFNRLFLKSALRSFFLEFTYFILYLNYRRGGECVLRGVGKFHQSLCKTIKQIKYHF